MIVFFNNSFIPKEKASVSPEDRGFLFADGVYEVIRSYEGRLFKTDDHIERLKRSLRELRIELPPSLDIASIATELLSRNSLESGDALVYIQVTRGVAPRSHAFPDNRTPPTLYMCATAFCHPREIWTKGIDIITLPDTRWMRCDIKSVALLANVLASQQAKEKGAHEAVFVRDGFVTEGTHTSLFALFGGRLFTHPADSRILAGITRSTVLGHCGELKIPVEESPIAEADLPKAEEIMVSSTTEEVTPVVTVNGSPVNQGKPGPMTRKLQQAFRDAVTR